MAGVGGGVRGDEEGLRSGEEESGQADGGRGAAGGGVREAPGGGADGGSGEAAGRVRASFTLRRVRIDPAGKRAEYIVRMECLMAGLDAIIADPSGVEDIQVRAMNSLVSAVRMCYRMVVDVERLEVELERLKEENRRAAEARGELGYRVEEDPAPGPG